MKSCLTKICYTRIRSIEGSASWGIYLDQLSHSQQQKVLRYIKWEDRCRTLFGKILLKNVLEDFGFTGDNIRRTQVAAFGRPYLDLPLDFNISHSGDFVVCAASLDCRVGIDIEAWSNINLHEFRSVLTNNEWNVLTQLEDPIPDFFKIWTQKESVIKADGRGLSQPLDEIEADDVKVIDNDKVWYLSKIEIAKEYSTWLTTDKSNSEIELLEMQL